MVDFSNNSEKPIRTKASSYIQIYRHMHTHDAGTHKHACLHIVVQIHTHILNYICMISYSETTLTKVTQTQKDIQGMHSLISE